MPTEQDIQQQLLTSRRRLKKEMQIAISCISAASKRRLVARWKEEYSQLMYETLVACARNKNARQVIANWDLDNFDEQRKK